MLARLIWPYTIQAHDERTQFTLRPLRHCIDSPSFAPALEASLLGR